jgi:hypothetical protein
MSAMGETTGPLDIGRVIQDLFAVLGRNFVTFLVLAAILVGIPELVVGYLQLNFLQHGATFSWQTLVGAVVAALGGLILQGTIIYGTVTDMNGRRASLADSLSIGLRSFLPLLGIGILFGLAMGFGFVLLIVPGIMIAVAWCVAVPTYVVEQPPLLEAFGRSAQLTRGNRWRIFALFILYLVVLIIVEAVFGVLGMASRLMTGGGVSMVTALVFRPLIGIANGLIAATGGAVLYVELRRVRDGVRPRDDRTCRRGGARTAAGSPAAP